MASGDWKRTPEVSAGESLCDREAWQNDVPKRDRYEIALLGRLVGVARRVDDPELTRVVAALVRSDRVENAMHREMLAALS